MGGRLGLVWCLGLPGCLINSSLYVERAQQIQDQLGTDPSTDTPTAETGEPDPIDSDGDGWLSDLDCDDGDSSVFPGACEVCADGIDQDCSGADAECHPALEPGFELEASALSFTGASQGDNAGIVVGGAGDFNGDGLADLVIGASQADNAGDASGSAYLLLSPISSSGQLISAIRLDGEQPDDRAGVSVSSADFDSDGFSDLIVGAKNHGDLRGAAYVVPGGAQPLSLVEPLRSAAARFVGEPGGSAGWWVAGLSGVTGEQRGGVAIGAPLQDSARGRIYLLEGAAITPGTSADLIDVAGVLDGELPGDEAGSSLDEIGDVDGDGLDDLLVASMRANNATGAAYLVLGDPALGSNRRALSTAEYIFSGEQLGDQVGSSVGGGGDVDGDGRDDLLIGARRESSMALEQGAVYLVGSDTLGPLAPPLRLALSDATSKIVGEASGDWLGQSVTIPGDVDCDGYADLLIGADRYGAGAAGAGDEQGAAYLIFGPVSGLRRLAADPTAVAFYGTPGADDRLGGHLDGAGDVDGDGTPDLIIGAYAASVGGLPGVGRSWLVFGAPL